MRIICESQVTSELLNKAGIISLNDECLIKGRTFTIFSHKTQSSVLNKQADVLKIEIPPLNNIINASIPYFTMENQSTVFENQQKTLREIGTQIKDMKQSASEGVLTKAVSYHDVHHYVVIYLFLAGVLVCGAVLVWRRRRGRQARTALSSPPPAEVSTTSVELKTFSEVHKCKCGGPSGTVHSEVDHKNKIPPVSPHSGPSGVDLGEVNHKNKATSPVFR